MNITKLKLKNIGEFQEELEIQFGRRLSKKNADIHIFTGLNGSGKSTILYAIANSFHGHDSHKSSSKHSIYSILQGRYQIDSEYTLTIESKGQEHQIVGNNTNGTFVLSYIPPKFDPSILPNYIKSDGTCDSAIFTYSGARNFEYQGGRVNLNLDFEHLNPFAGALNFNLSNDLHANNNSQMIVNWVASLKFEVLGLKDQGNTEQASQKEQIILKVEEVVSQLLNNDFKFIFNFSEKTVDIQIGEKIINYAGLSDGYKSILGLIGDLLMRIDLVKWSRTNIPANEQCLTILLDEVDIHLHPSLQRKILPILQKLFINAQIFVTTHSPFVVNSISDAWIYELDEENMKQTSQGRVLQPVRSEDSISYSHALDEFFGIRQRFGSETEDLLSEFQSELVIARTIKAKNKPDKFNKLFRLYKQLSNKGGEVEQIVTYEMNKLRLN
jgi:predicted ATP-binding protein involved in virulence